MSTLRVRGYCEEGFPEYNYLCRKFTDVVSRLKKWTGKTKLKNELLTELEAQAQYFTEDELEIVFYMSEDDWVSTRARFVSSPGEARNRVTLREEPLTVTAKPGRKVLWELLEKDLNETIGQKTFICVLASSDLLKLSSIARDIFRSTRPVVNADQRPSIIFLDTKSGKNLSLSEMKERNFEFIPPKISKSPEVDTLYARVEEVLKTRILMFLQLLLKFIQGHLPPPEKGQQPVDLYELGHMKLEYVEEKKVLWKIMFEAFTWARCMKISIDTPIPGIPKLSEGLQRALLSLEGVKGCGTIWGKLTLHVAADKMSEISRSKLVPSILQAHGYTAGYRVHEFVKREMQAGYGIMPGCKLQTKLTEEGKRKLEKSKAEIGKEKQDVSEKQKMEIVQNGTLGCFVSGRKVTGGLQAAENAYLYAITCAHCIEDCEGDIKAKDSYDSFRRISGMSADTTTLCKIHSIDIAALKVDKEMEKCCILNMNDDGLADRTLAPGDPGWRIYSGPAESLPVGLAVFKKGSVTQLTHGTVTSNDYITSELMRRGKPFAEMYNVLIDVTVGAPAGVASASGGASPVLQGATARTDKNVFSEAGDSGAAICGQVSGDFHVQVISILGGSIATEDRGVKYECSYSTLLKPSLDLLGNQANITFSVPGIPQAP